MSKTTDSKTAREQETETFAARNRQDKAMAEALYQCASELARPCDIDKDKFYIHLRDIKRLGHRPLDALGASDEALSKSLKRLGFDCNSACLGAEHERDESVKSGSEVHQAFIEARVAIAMAKVKLDDAKKKWRTLLKQRQQQAAIAILNEMSEEIGGLDDDLDMEGIDFWNSAAQ